MTGDQMGGIDGLLAAFSGAFSNSNAEKSAADFKSKQLVLNSKLADLQGQSTIEAGDAEAALTGLKVKSVVGKERAEFASQGVNVDAGSPSNVQSSSLEQGALEEETIRANAWRQAWGFNVESSNYKSEAEMTQLEGKAEADNTLLTGGLKGMDALVKGFSK